MTVHHGLLGWMQLISFCQSFNSDNMLTRELTDWRNTGINRSIADTISIRRPHHHRTGATVTRGTTFLGAGEPVAAEVVEQRRICRHIDIMYLLIDEQFQELTIWTDFADNLAQSTPRRKHMKQNGT